MLDFGDGEGRRIVVGVGTCGGIGIWWRRHDEQRSTKVSLWVRVL